MSTQGLYIIFFNKFVKKLSFVHKNGEAVETGGGGPAGPRSLAEVYSQPYRVLTSCLQL